MTSLNCCYTPVYQDIYPDLCEMRCYVVEHKYRLAIDLESELAAASLAHRFLNGSPDMQCCSNAFDSSLPDFVIGQPHVMILCHGYTKGLSAATVRSK